jgi:hypothetical protein
MEYTKLRLNDSTAHGYSKSTSSLGITWSTQQNP